MFTPGKPFNPVDWLRHLDHAGARSSALAGVGPILRYVRTSILETLGSDYLVTARAKGLGRADVIVRHAFPNGLLPLITLIGIHVGTLMAGAFITENIFTWPGMGTLGLCGDQQQGLPGPPGLRDGRRDHGAAREPAGRPRLRLRRPADPAGVTAMTAPAITPARRRRAPARQHASQERERRPSRAPPIPPPPGRAGRPDHPGADRRSRP